MTAGGTGTRVAPSPLRRAHRSLCILIIISTLAAGGMTAAVAAAPSPMTGIGFAFSALLLAAAGTLAGRVVIALERVRRLSRPPTAPLSKAPLFNKLATASRRW